MKVYKLETVNGRVAANQFVIKEDRRIVFQSYNSTILGINYNDMTLTVGYHWDYSRTTSKYLKIFLKENLWWSDEKVERFRKEIKKAEKKRINDFLFDNWKAIYDKELT